MTARTFSRTVAATAFLLLPASCRQVRYATAVTERSDSASAVVRDTVWRERTVLRHDSTSRRDSVHVREYVLEVRDTAGRVVHTDRATERYELREDGRYTALLGEYRELEREYRALSRAYVDRRSEPYPVEREPTRRERVEMAAGRAALWLLLPAAAVWAFIIYRKHRQ